MVVTEFQPLNSCMFQDELFPIEPEATLSRLELTDDNPDDTEGVVSVSSGCRQV